jgi:ferredoxin-NADP reductase
LARLSDEHRWLRVVHSVTRDPGEPRAAYHRRIDRDLLAAVLDGEVPPQAYLCGPPAMVEATVVALTDLGVDPSRVRSEKYD